MKVNLILWTLVILLALTRPFLPVHIDWSWLAFYKDFTHLLVGGIVGAALVKRSWNLFWMAAIPSVVELIVALAKGV